MGSQGYATSKDLSFMMSGIDFKIPMDPDAAAKVAKNASPERKEVKKDLPDVKKSLAVSPMNASKKAPADLKNQTYSDKVGKKLVDQVRNQKEDDLSRPTMKVSDASPIKKAQFKKPESDSSSSSSGDSEDSETEQSGATNSVP